MKSKMYAINAGSKHNNFTLLETLMISTSHGLPIVVPKTSGTFNVGRDNPYEAVALAVAINPIITPVTGAKSATKFRSFLAKKGVDLMFTSTLAVKKVMRDMDVETSA